MSLKVCINPDCQMGINHDHQYQDDCQNRGVCLACGYKLPAEVYEKPVKKNHYRYCPICDAQNQSDADKCVKCGYNFEQYSSEDASDGITQPENKGDTE